ncbi:DNA-3-methyladenine glycosylase [Peribacillus saganii]|uniref:Putative 3-methyladenine DNA glycosylase n=1 Tax=Peribacillus saganii TaxID=2303992 RepID=A0A372LUD2_9BACI|nr:DNA-3-methyladenine glycosylase [Peribacillus saganii]RFU71422.1 DNA-3-methyladenine glycosylase [Peribacillus saganii]
MDKPHAFLPVSRDFFDRPTLELAKELLGCLLVKEAEDGLAAGYIVETEAYIGPGDRAAHSFENRRTKRTEIMFADSGYAYTYLMHTHCLVNVVSGGSANPEAVLIRAIEPAYGTELMSARRRGAFGKNIANGPGKLTKALGISMEDYGHPLWQSPLFIAEGTPPHSITEGKRIGIENSGEARDYLWRFWITGNQFVSRHRKEEK